MRVATIQFDIELPTGSITPVQRAWITREVFRRVGGIDFAPAFVAPHPMRGRLRRPLWRKPPYHPRRSARGG